MQNFGKIKNTFNELLVEGLSTNNVNNKNLFKKYVKFINENDMLRTQFLVYSNIENKVESDREKAKHFVTECIGLFSKMDKKKLFKLNETLFKLAKSENTPNYLNEELHENISKLIFTKKGPNSIDAIVESTDFIVNFIMANKGKEITESFDLPNSFLLNTLAEKYNEKYADLTENEKEILKAVNESTDEEKKDLYIKNLKECIKLVNENLQTSELNAKEKLLLVKEKLLNDEAIVNEDYFKKISKLIELQDSLKNNV